jgi:hypothetical protein
VSRGAGEEVEVDGVGEALIAQRIEVTGSYSN